MSKKPDAATLDIRKYRGAARRIAKLRAVFCGILAVGSAWLLIAALVDGRFEKMRRLGTIVFVENPFMFVAVAMGWALAICGFAWLALHFWDESRR